MNGRRSKDERRIIGVSCPQGTYRVGAAIREVSGNYPSAREKDGMYQLFYLQKTSL